MSMLTNNIRARRKEMGMTQKELAERLDISDKTVSRWESGGQTPDADMLPEIAEALGVSVGALFGEQTEEREEDPIKKQHRERYIFRLLMVVGSIVSVLGAVVQRNFSQAASANNGVVDLEYYNTGKGIAADVLAFIGIVMIFAGFAVMLVGKVRFSMRNPSPLSDELWRENMIFSGMAAITVVLVTAKISPGILKFGFLVPQYVYGFIIAAAATALMWKYRRELCARGYTCTVVWLIVGAAFGVIGFVSQIAAEQIINAMFIGASGGTAAQMQTYMTQSAAIQTAVSVASFGVILMPLIPYVQMIILSRKMK